MENESHLEIIVNLQDPILLDGLKIKEQLLSTVSILGSRHFFLIDRPLLC